MAKSREGIGSPVYQGADEALSYTVTTTNWGSSPTSPSAKIFSFDLDTEAYTDVTATNMSGLASASGDVVTTPQISGLTAGTRYRVEVQFTIGTNVFEMYFWIWAQR